MHQLRILIVCRDRVDATVLTSMLKSLGHMIEEAAEDRLAVELIELKNIDLVLSEVDLLAGQPLEFLRYVRHNHRGIPIILLFPRPHSERAREALRLRRDRRPQLPCFRRRVAPAVLQGLESSNARAFRSVSPAPPPTPSLARSLVPTLSSSTADHLEFEPVFTPDRAATVGPSTRLHSPSASTACSPVVHGSPAPATASSMAGHAAHLAREFGLLGTDPSWCKVIELTRAVAASQMSILIVGEPGTGKSRLARLFHLLGPNPERPFVTVESSAMADELSSHVSRHTADPACGNDPRLWGNKLAEARGGTIYVDEVAACRSSFNSTFSANCTSATMSLAPASLARRRRAVRCFNRR